VRFWNTDVLTNMEGVLQVISELLCPPPHPSPLPHCAVERGNFPLIPCHPPLPHIVGERVGVRGN
jgi:hypothetical protein